MALNTSSTESILGALARGYQIAQQKAQLAQRQQEHQDEVIFRDKQAAESIKRDERDFKAQQGHQSAVQKLAQATFNLSKNERLQKIGQNIQGGEPAPPGFAQLPPSVMGALTGNQYASEQGDVINTVDPATYAAQQGQRKLLEQQPTLDAHAKINKELIEARSAADLANDLRTQARETKNRETDQAFKTAESEKDRANQLAIAQMHYGTASADRHLRALEMQSNKVAGFAKLDQNDQKFLAANKATKELVDEAFKAGEAVVQSGRWKGQKVKDVALSEGVGSTIKNTFGRALDYVTNTESPEIDRFTALVQKFTAQDMHDLFGAAISPTEVGNSAGAFVKLNDWRRNRTQVFEALNNVREALRKSKVGFVKTLNPYQQAALDDTYKNKKVVKNVPDGKGGFNLVEEEE